MIISRRPCDPSGVIFHAQIPTVPGRKRFSGQTRRAYCSTVPVQKTKIRTFASDKYLKIYKTAPKNVRRCRRGRRVRVVRTSARGSDPPGGHAKPVGETPCIAS